MGPLTDPVAELSRFPLPVSGHRVALRAPTGSEDLLLVESPATPAGDAVLAAALAERLARAVDRGPVDWRGLAVTDLDAFVLRLRQALLGDRVRADLPCPTPSCGRRIDLSFGIDEFLDHQAPQADEAACEPDDEPGWFRLGGSDVRFRLPTVDDLLAVAGLPAPESALIRQCLRPADPPEAALDRVEAAMEALAPSLSCDLQGVCPECGSDVSVAFDARWYCLRELRDRAAFVFGDVDVLARRYHWSESEILALPHGRRSAYAELARQAEGA